MAFKAFNGTAVNNPDGVLWDVNEMQMFWKGCVGGNPSRGACEACDAFSRSLADHSQQVLLIMQVCVWTWKHAHEIVLHLR